MLKTLRLLREHKHHPWHLTDKAREHLRQFQGFGNHKEILYSDSPLSLREDGGESLLSILRDIYPDRHEEALSQLKASTLSSFYTPQPIVDALRDSLHEAFSTYDIHPRTFLDPSAGTGAFLSVAPSDCKKVCFEKDIVTADILRLLHHDDPSVTVHNQPFETISSLPTGEGRGGAFDLIASNIPFGNYKVYDPLFSSTKKLTGMEIFHWSMKRIHTYYFVKSMSLLKDNGILAFITTRAICDTPDNKPLRQFLIRSADLVSAVRLPDNLFRCGVGTDLLIFRRNDKKKTSTPKEQHFINATIFPSVLGDTSNEQGSVLATEIKPGTDPYGKPTTKYIFKS